MVLTRLDFISFFPLLCQEKNLKYFFSYSSPLHHFYSIELQMKWWLNSFLYHIHMTRKNLILILNKIATKKMIKREKKIFLKKRKTIIKGFPVVLAFKWKQNEWKFVSSMSTSLNVRNEQILFFCFIFGFCRTKN